MDWLARRAGITPGRPAIHLEDRTLSYAELDELVEAFVSTMTEAGVRSGDRVGLLAANTLASSMAWWAVPRAGAVVVPVDPGDPGASGRLREAGSRWVVEGTGSHPHLDSFEGSRRGGRRSGLRAIFFTSGSTGRSRGVMLTRENLEASAAASATVVGNGRDDRWLAVLPLFHVGGASILERSAREGGSTVLLKGFHAEDVAAALTGGRITVASLVPTMLFRLLRALDRPPVGLRMVLIGGGPTPPELVMEALARGVPVAPTYGMTETASQVATLLPAAAHRRPESSGRPVPGAEIRVTDEDGTSLAPGLEGRIEVRGRMVSPGNLSEPLRPPGSWFSTADTGLIDQDGYLVVKGRRDDVIVTGGEKVRPEVVENVLRAHPLVADAAVIGEADVEWGDRVVALIVPAGDGLDVEALRLAVREELAPHELPKVWRVVDDLPRTALGKLDRGRLTRGDAG